LPGAAQHAIETIKPLYPEQRTVHTRFPLLQLPTGVFGETLLF
jgi:hypothetical protein